MISVKAYGATGDGVTDDRAAIQSALNTGAHVFVPPGTYAIASGSLRIWLNTRLTVDPGATILRAGATEGLISNIDPTGPGGYTGHGGSIIEGGVWDLNGLEHPAYACGIVVAHAEDFIIRDLTVLNTPGWHAIEVNSSKSVLIDNCRFRGFTHNGDRGFSETIQIDAALSPETGTFPFDGTVCDGIEVRSCRFGGGGADGTQPWPRAVGTHTAPATWHRHIRVLNNVVDSPGVCGIRTYWWDRAVISGNQISDSAGDGIVVDYCSRYIEVHGNQVFDSGKNGLLVAHDCTQINLRDNDIIGSGRSAHATYGGIRVADSSYVRAIGNTVRGRASGNQARHGLWLEGSASGIQRYGNDVRHGGSVSDIRDDSPNPVTTAGDAT